MSHITCFCFGFAFHLASFTDKKQAISYWFSWLGKDLLAFKVTFYSSSRIVMRVLWFCIWSAQPLNWPKWSVTWFLLNFFWYVSSMVRTARGIPGKLLLIQNFLLHSCKTPGKLCFSALHSWKTLGFFLTCYLEDRMYTAYSNTITISLESSPERS